MRNMLDIHFAFETLKISGNFFRGYKTFSNYYLGNEKLRIMCKVSYHNTTTVESWCDKKIYFAAGYNKHKYIIDMEV